MKTGYGFKTVWKLVGGKFVATRPLKKEIGINRRRNVMGMGPKKTPPKKNWISGAIKHPGRCTPMSKPGCTGAARALAIRFKKGGDLHAK